MNYKTLECSTKGDKRFSALRACLTWIDGHTYDSIENIYQRSKCFNGITFFERIKAKGRKPTSVIILGKQYPVEYLTPFYKTLWYKYLVDNPKLIEVINGYDKFTDCFKTSKTINCQADVIFEFRWNRKRMEIEIKQFLENIGYDGEFKFLED